MVFKNEKQVFGKSIFRMHWVVGTWLITSLLGLGMGHNTLFEGYGTLSGYHLCNVTELVSVTNVISYPTSYTQRRPCGGWLPWTMCDVTVYKTEYQTQVYNMSKQVMKCCHGYEQVGSYCAVSLNRSAEFTSKPGLCPLANVTGSLRNHSSSSGSMCKWDIDCPQWQKCCQTENISNIYQCADPVPANRTCFNVTITVKTSLQLVTMDKGLFNHTRLLYSMVTGALGTAEISVHHVQVWSAGPFTISSSLLVCSSNVSFLDDISTRLNRLGNIEEVTNVVVQDVDECAVPVLNICSPDAHCMKTARSYSCACHHGYQDLNYSQPGTVCMAPSVTTHPLTNNTTTPSRTTLPPTDNTTYTDGEQMSAIPSARVTPIVDPSSRSNNPSISQPASTCDYIPEITSLFSGDVNASAFHVAWTTNNHTGVTFYLVLLKGTTEVENMSHVENFNWTFTDLNPATLYTVRVTPFACGNRGNSSEIKVRTDGQTLLVTARFTNMNYTVALSDPTSDAYKAFCDGVMDEIFLSSPPDIRALLISKQITIQITSLSAGSVIVNFSITFQISSNQNMSSMATDLASLRNSSKYTVDNSSIHIQVVNECLAAEADCSPWASCNKTVGSYTCACWSGYTDLSLSRPGRSCAASLNATTTINPTTNYPGVSSNATATITTSSITTNSSMSSTVSTPHVQSNTNTTVSSTATTNRLTTNIPTTILAPMTQNPIETTASVQQASNITGPLVSYVTVECRIWNTSVFIRKDALQAHGIPENALYLGEPQCVANKLNDSHVWLTAAWNKCNTTLENNSTHTSFNLILYNNFSVASNVHLEVPIICTYPSEIIISTGYSAPTGYDMINAPVAGFGSFQVTVRLLNGTSPLPENYAFSKDEEVVVEVGVNTTIPQIKLVINTCWVTSGRDSTVSLGPVFLQDGCAVANKHTTVLQNGNDTVSLLSVRIFSLMDQDVIFLHCQIQICVEIQDKTCKPDCSGRAYRSFDLTGTTASIGPLNRLLKAPPQNDTSNTLQTVGFVLLGVGVFLLSLAAIAGLVCHKRKIGNYNFNFNPQQENFSYHVFST